MRLVQSIAVMAGVFCFVQLSWAEDWAQFRGPDGRGIASEPQLPSEWGPEANIKWKVAVPGFGWSQPIAVGDRLYVTTAITENQQRPQSGGFGGRGGPPPGGKGGFPPGGKGGLPPGGEGGFRRGGAQPEGKADGGKAGPPGNGGRGGFGGGAPPNAVYQWKLFCLDRGTGKALWEGLAHEGKPTIGIQPSNTFASQTPVSDGERVYAYFGMTGIFCFDLDGKLLWSKNLGSYPVAFGPGSSPALDSDRVFVQCDNDEQSFLVALDKRTGDEVWRVERNEGSNYCTPYVWKNKLRTELVTSGSKVRSYDPATGKLLWEYGILGGGCKATPVGNAELLYVGTAGGGGGFGGRGGFGGGPGGGKGPGGPGGPPGASPGAPPGGPGGPGRGGGGAANSPLVAIKAGAAGDISLSGTEKSSGAVAWSIAPGGAEMASPLLYQDCVYVLQRSGGIVGCYDALTGQQHYRQRLPEAGEFWCSPWAADGKVFCLDQDGRTFVLKAGPMLEILATNKLDDTFRASVAIAKGEIVLRGVDHLYCITRP